MACGCFWPSSVGGPKEFPICCPASNAVSIAPLSLPWRVYASGPEPGRSNPVCLVLTVLMYFATNMVAEQTTASNGLLACQNTHQDRGWTICHSTSQSSRQDKRSNTCQQGRQNTVQNRCPAAFMIGDVSKHIPDLTPEQANIVSIHISDRLPG